MYHIQIKATCIAVVVCLVKIPAVVLGLLGQMLSLSHCLKGLTPGMYGQTDSVCSSKDRNCSSVVAFYVRSDLPLTALGK